MAHAQPCYHENNNNNLVLWKVMFFKMCVKVVSMIMAGYRHSAAVTEDGDLYTWGEGDYGRLGTLYLTHQCFLLPLLGF